MAKITISIPQILKDEIKKYKGRFNISKVCTDALEKEIKFLKQKGLKCKQ